MILAILGARLNNLAVISNHCRMPIQTGYAISTPTHFSFIEKMEVNNYLATDIISLPLIEGWISIGDILINLGVIIIISLMIVFGISKFKQWKF